MNTEVDSHRGDSNLKEILLWESHFGRGNSKLLKAVR
jgi:hypothetical protein